MVLHRRLQIDPLTWGISSLERHELRRGQIASLSEHVAAVKNRGGGKRLFVSREPNPRLLLRWRVIARSCVHAQLR